MTGYGDNKKAPQLADTGSAEHTTDLPETAARDGLDADEGHDVKDGHHTSHSSHSSHVSLESQGSHNVTNHKKSARDDDSSHGTGSCSSGSVPPSGTVATAGLDLPLAFRLALRELRAGKRGFVVFLSCLFLGVFAIAAVGSVSESARAALGRDARALMGGDISIRLTSVGLPDHAREWLEQRGELSEATTLRGMARTVPSGAEQPDATLVHIKGVDSVYPLYGEVVLDPPMPLAEAMANRDGEDGTVIGPLLQERLGVAVGDVLRVGESTLRIRAILVDEPDRVLQGVTFGPRVMLSAEALERTGLIRPGSIMSQHVRLRLPQSLAGDETRIKAFADSVRNQFASEGWRVRPYTQAAPRIRNILDRLDMQLMLIGLGALLVGGLGIAEAVRGYLASRISHIAAMKCVGGSVLTVVAVYLLQIGMIGLMGVVAGCIAGAMVPPAVAGVLSAFLPVPLETGIYWKALGRAAAFGIAIVLAFSLRSLLVAGNVSPAILFRGYVATSPRRLTTKGRGAVAFAFALLATLVFVFTDDKRLAAGFIVLTVGCFMVFRVVAFGMRKIAGIVSMKGSPSVRLGLSAIHRPGAPTESLVFALGLGLTALVAVAQIEANLTRTLQRDLSRDAPAFFFINVLPDQRDAFSGLLERDGVTRTEAGPMLRGRIVKIAGVPVENAVISPDVRWAVRGDRGLTTRAAPPDDTQIVSGEWWAIDYSGPPAISLTRDLAEGFGVAVGDTLTFNILGREITATIANTREVDWMTFQLQFAVVFAPGLLDQAPFTWVYTVYGQGDAMDDVYREVTGRFANVTAFSMRDILADVRNIMRRMGQVFRGMASVMLVTGFLVLAGAITADRHRRIYDAVVYKVCGATSWDILKALVTEFAAVGLATGIFSALTGGLAAWAAIEGLMEFSFVLEPLNIVVTILAGGGFAVLFGLLGTARALRRKPAPYLRNE